MINIDKLKSVYEPDDIVIEQSNEVSKDHNRQNPDMFYKDDEELPLEPAKKAGTKTSSVKGSSKSNPRDSSKDEKEGKKKKDKSEDKKKKDKAKDDGKKKNSTKK